MRIVRAKNLTFVSSIPDSQDEWVMSIKRGMSILIMNCCLYAG